MPTPFLTLFLLWLPFSNNNLIRHHRGRAAVGHLGRAQQPQPQPVSGRALVGHLGRARPPASAPTSTRAAVAQLGRRPQPAPQRTNVRAAVLRNTFAKLPSARLSAPTVVAGISFDAPTPVNTPQQIRYTVRVNLQAELYDISQGSYPGLADAIARRFRQAVQQTYAPPRARGACSRLSLTSCRET